MSRPTLKNLRAAAQRAATAEAVASSLRAERDRLALDVYEAATLDEPVTYNALAEALGVTRDRVSQVLAVQRDARRRATTTLSA